MASSSNTPEKISVVCKLCNNFEAKYCCPRCNILYCSLDCFRSKAHLECSEEFYKRCIKEEFVPNDVGKKETMMKVLKKVHESNLQLPESFYKDALDSDDDEDVEDLGKRLAGVDLDNPEIVWSKLTEDEKKEFEAFLKSGDISKILPKWEPWWNFHTTKKVLDVSEINDFKKKCPPVINEIEDMLTLVRKYPADIVKYNIINVLTAYTFTVRYFNGDHFEFPHEAVSYIASLSLVLKLNFNFESYSLAIESVHQEILLSSWIPVDEENIQNMREDIHKLLRGPYKQEKKFYIFVALSDLCNLLETTIKTFNKKGIRKFSQRFPESQFPVILLESKDKLRKHLKKFEFFLSYVKDCWTTNV